jgi:hypothetical protein
MLKIDLKIEKVVIIVAESEIRDQLKSQLLDPLKEQFFNNKVYAEESKEADNDNGSSRSQSEVN